MRESYTHKSKYFYGHEISDYGIKNGFVDYRTLAKCFDAVLNNEIISKTSEIGCWETVNGSEFWEDEEGNEYTSDIFQYFIIDARGAEILQKLTDEIIFYNDFLDMYIWGVTHYGTSWDYVLTNIKIELNEDDENDESDEG